MSRLSFVVVLMSLLVMTSCEQGRRDGAKGRSGEVLARIGRRSITMKDLRLEIRGREPYIRSRYASRNGKLRLLKSMVDFELLSLKARSENMLSDPQVRWAYRRAVVRRLLQREVVGPARSKAVSESEVSAYYRSHPTEFRKPEMRQLRHIFFAISQKGMRGRKLVRSTASKVLDRARGRPGRPPESFKDLAHRISEDRATMKKGGALGLVSQKELARKWGAEAAGKVFAFDRAGHPFGPIRSAKGFHVVLVEKIVPARVLPLFQARTMVIARIHARRRRKLYKRFLARLRRKFKVKISQDLPPATGGNP